MSATQRRWRFFLGLNIWGFGLLGALKAYGSGETFGWVEAIVLLLVGSVLLTESLIFEVKSD